MGITFVWSKTICHPSSVQNRRYLIHGKEGLGPRVLPWQHHSGIILLLSFLDGHCWCQVWMASLKYFKRYYQICDLSTYFNQWWRHPFLSKNFNISGIIKNLSKRKVLFLLTLKNLSNKESYFLLHTHFKGSKRNNFVFA